jgi:hypothetical protein
MKPLPAWTMPRTSGSPLAAGAEDAAESDAAAEAVSAAAEDEDEDELDEQPANTTVPTASTAAKDMRLRLT